MRVQKESGVSVNQGLLQTSKWPFPKGPCPRPSCLLVVHRYWA